jgi:hypothetical protein
MGRAGIEPAARVSSTMQPRMPDVIGSLNPFSTQ